jgi:hypothetical protein
MSSGPPASAGLMIMSRPEAGGPEDHDMSGPGGPRSGETSVPRHQRPHRVEHAQAAAVQERQPLAVAQDLDLQDLLKFRRQLVGLEHRQQPDRLVGLVKLGSHPRFVHAVTKKIGQY